MKKVDYSILDKLGKRFDSSGEPPDDSDMEARVKKLEDEMLTIKTDLGIIKATHATKTDIAEMKSAVSASETAIHKEMHALTWKLIGAAGLLVAAVYFVATHVSK